MKVAIVHYHLGPGGVTQIITASSRALARAEIPHIVLIGNQDSLATHAPDLPVRMVSGMEYRNGPQTLTPDELVRHLRTAAMEALGSPPDVWHFHNHSLGKNPLVAGAVARLANNGERMILQIHDLAEDGRPANYPNIGDLGHLYPFSSRITYQFLNSRNRQIFIDSGLPPECAGILPNPVDPPAALPAPPGKPLLFAPIRGIRRKNLGELVFLSALATDGVRIAISRSPLDSEALRIHDTWSAFVQERRMPLLFSVVDRLPPVPGADSSFESWISHASHIISTSVSEGFGLPFLEASVWQKPLIGRNLADLSKDHGIHTGGLYDRLLVPLDWVGSNILREHISTTIWRNFRHLPDQPTPDIEDAIYQALVREGCVDFGNLPEAVQQAVIERVKDPHMRRIPMMETQTSFIPAEDWLAAAVNDRTRPASHDPNGSFSPKSYQKALISILDTLQAVEPPLAAHFLAPEKILSRFLAPECFHFLRSIPPPLAKEQFRIRAVIFDIYGTLLIAPAGGIKPDPDVDPALRKIISDHGHKPPESPSRALHEIILRHHAASPPPYPEVDLRVIWREMLSLDPGRDTSAMIAAAEAAWHPVHPMPGAAHFVGRLARSGIAVGLLSNAQCNTLSSLGGLADLFAPELCILSYQHGMAKPAPDLFWIMAERLEGRGIHPNETLYIGNDPLHDIVPAAAAGFRTAHFTGHPSSLRPGDCTADINFTDWRKLYQEIRMKEGVQEQNSSG